jgi:hypothetical protein
MDTQSDSMKRTKYIGSWPCFLLRDNVRNPILLDSLAGQTLCKICYLVNLRNKNSQVPKGSRFERTLSIAVPGGHFNRLLAKCDADVR